VAHAEPVPETKPQPLAEPPPPPPKVPKDAIAVGTFNLRWAFDHIEQTRRPKLARDRVAQSERDWEWKRDQIAEILVQERLDIVALQELGGERELVDIVSSVMVKGGYEYDVAWQVNDDFYTGQSVAILSRFPLEEVRRYDLGVAKHVVADVALPAGEVITVVAVHLREGHYASQAAGRAKQARALKRELNAIQKAHPVIVLGTVNSDLLPYDDAYQGEAPGILAGSHTRATEADDCMDSGDNGAAQRTTVEGQALDRIFSCGLRIRAADVAAVDRIRREAEDPKEAAWSAVPVEEAPFRDVSDHFVLWAEIELPKRASSTSPLSDPWATPTAPGQASGTTRTAF